MWVVGPDWLPGARVPDDDVTPAVLLGRNHALEVEVLDRMVLHAHGQPPHLRGEGRTLRHGPAHEDPVYLEPHVVVEPAGPMSLHHEPRPVRCGCDPAAWLGGAREVPLATVDRQRLAHAQDALRVEPHEDDSLMARAPCRATSCASYLSFIGPSPVSSTSARPSRRYRSTGGDGRHGGYGQRQRHPATF